MDQSRSNWQPLLVVLLLLLPLLYLGSYLALVTPAETITSGTSSDFSFECSNYRFAHQYGQYFYSPLEQIDRTLRPKKWEWYPPIYDDFSFLHHRLVVPEEPDESDDPQTESDEDPND